MKKSEPVYQALWAGPKDFDEVLISPVMIQDHMPDNMLKALNKVSEQALVGGGKHPNFLTNHLSNSVTKPGVYEPLEETREVSNSSVERNEEEEDEADDSNKLANGGASINVNEPEKQAVEESPNDTTIIVVDVEVHQRNENQVEV